MSGPAAGVTSCSFDSIAVTCNDLGGVSNHPESIGNKLEWCYSSHHCEAGYTGSTSPVKLSLCSMFPPYFPGPWVRAPRRVQAAIAEGHRPGTGSVRRALCGALHEEVTDFYRLIAVLEGQLNVPIPVPGWWSRHDQLDDECWGLHGIAGDT